MRYITLVLLTAIFLRADNITVTIAYGDRAEKTVETTYQKDDTALDILNKVAKITVTKGKYKFVRSIDGKKSIPGVYGWFYLINGESPGKMASDYKLEDAFSMRWYYKVEQCY